MNNVNFPKINSKGLVVDRIIDEIKKAILEERLSHGDRLPPENTLVKMLGVSRGPIREALGALRVAGIIEVIRGNGTYISKKIPLSPMAPLLFSLLLQKGSPTEAFELREMLEIGILEIVVDKVTQDDFEKMQKTIEELKLDYKKDIINSKLSVKHDLDFHYAFAESTHNELIVELTQAFWEVFSFWTQKCLWSKENIKRTIKNHSDILEALKKKDINKAKEAIKQAVRGWETDGILRGEETSKLRE